MEKEDELETQIEEENKKFGDAKIYRIIPGDGFNEEYEANFLLSEEEKEENIKLGYAVVQSIFEDNKGDIPFKTYLEEKDRSIHNELMESIERKIIRGQKLIGTGNHKK